MSAVTPRTQSQGLPANGVITGAVQVTGTALRISARQTSGNVALTLALIRMNPGSGNWFRVTDENGKPREFSIPGVGDSNQGNADINVTLPAEGAGEWYHLLIDSPSAFTGTAEIESLSAPAAAGGTVPSGRAVNTTGGVTGGGDLSADRTIQLGGTADATWSTGAQSWAGAAGKAGSLIAGTGAALAIGANGAAAVSADAAGAGLLMASGRVFGFGPPQSLSGAGAANATTRTTLLTSTAVGQAVSLANGVLAGQRKTLVAHSGFSPNTTVVTPATPSGFATLTFSGNHQCTELEWTGSAWVIVGNSGAAIA